MKPLTDTDPMRFGQHKGTPMQDVPASYLHWLWQECGLKHMHTGHGSDRCLVAKYIHENLNALKLENPDLIWS